MHTYIISPIDATGQHDDFNAFAYANDRKRCKLIGSPFWVEYDKTAGMRQRVQLLDGTEGEVWEDELESYCDGSDCLGCWQCDS